MDSSYYIQINVSVRRDIICDITVHGIHKRGVGIVLLQCVQLKLLMILRLTSLMTTQSILVRVCFCVPCFSKLEVLQVLFSSPQLCFLDCTMAMEDHLNLQYLLLLRLAIMEGLIECAKNLEIDG